jgi:HK97 family phage portal protein
MSFFSRKKEPENIEKRSLDGIEFSTVAAPSEDILQVFKAGSKQAMQLSAVFRAVSVISDSISLLRPQLYRKLKDGYREEIYDPQIIKEVYDRPNQIMSWSDTLKCLVVSYLLDGNAYLYIKRDHRGIPISLIPIAPSRVVITYDEVNFTIRYHIMLIGDVEHTDLIHIRNFVKAGQPYLGESPLNYSDETLGLAHYCQKYVSDFFAKGANSGYLSTEANLSTPTKPGSANSKKNTADKLREMWSKVTGIRVLDNGLQWKSYSVSLKDHMLHESRQESVNDIARIFNCNPRKLYSSTATSAKSTEAENTEFIIDCLLPIVTKMSTEINDKLFASNLKRQYELFFDPFTLQKQNLLDYSQYAQNMVRSGIHTRNEFRKVMRLPKMEGCDIVTVQMQDIPIDQIENINSKKDLKTQD